MSYPLSNRVGTYWRLAARLKSCPPIFLAALHEIFDESAYARFLERSRMVGSREAYAAFLREHELAKARRPRCC
jgi:hypothetical protein